MWRLGASLILKRSANRIRATMSAVTTRSLSTTTPTDVLRFWFGEDVWGTEKMEAPNMAKLPMWFGFKSDMSGSISSEDGKAIDEECRQFAPLIHACESGEMDALAEWQTPNGLYAKMLLFDQLSRNCFRGTPAAFQFDLKAIAICRQIFDAKYYHTYSRGEFQFFITPPQHSEDIKDHEMNVAILEFMIARFGADDNAVKLADEHITSHKVIVDKYGRYPHRNHLLGRENTPEEAAWLADYDNLPGFAKSQLPQPKA
eukprot:m.29121 g.29121  ORF g.29121 m.29121 type:complete len:258 (-) comp16043_c0_seq1:453-1226(-)